MPPARPSSFESDQAARTSFDKSGHYREAAMEVIAGGVNSNVRMGASPLCFASASGSKLRDIDGNEYIDYALGMGPAILGHAPGAILDAVAASLRDGQLFAGQHESELTLAKLLQQFVPSAELVRIGMTGSEMVQAALRVARAHTGKSGFIKFEGHYHGWFDNVLVNQSGPPADPNGPLPLPIRLQTAGQAALAAADTHVLPWNNADAVARYLEENADQIGALITEPVMCNVGVIPPRLGFLKELRRLCDQHNVVLIFDEVITGFRLGLGGAQTFFGVTPDLSTFAKAFGGGFPVAALAGRREIMSRFTTGEVNHSGTYNANVVSVVAGIATINQLSANNGAAYKRIQALGERLMVGIRDLAARYGSSLQVSGFGSVFQTFFGETDTVVDYASYVESADADALKGFLDALIPLGVRPTSRGAWFVSAAHSEQDVEQTLRAVDVVLQSDRFRVR